MPSQDLENEVEKFYKYYTDNFRTFEQSAEYYRSLLNSLVTDECEVQSITCRVKEKEECVSKFKRKYLQGLEEKGNLYEIKDHITDLIGLRIVCLYESEIEKLKGILEANFLVVDITDKIKSLESTDNQFGYKSLHVDIKLNDVRKQLPEFKKFADLRFEVQIRTIIQDAWSVLDHKIKYKKSVPSDLKRRINRLAALFEIADDEFYNIKLATTTFEMNARADIKPNEPINVLSFLTSVTRFFPMYQFIPFKADGFVHEILEYKEDLTIDEFCNAVEQNLEVVSKYNGEVMSKSPANYLNPYTTIRHCLYLSNKTVFNKVLFVIQKRHFEDWLHSSETSLV